MVLVEAGTGIGAHEIGVESREVTLSTSHSVVHMFDRHLDNKCIKLSFKEMDPAGLPRTINALDVRLLLEAAFEDCQV